MLLPLLLTLAVADKPEPAPLPPLKHKIAVIAHRGGKAIAPENTLAAFKKAIELGADYVEIDVRATKDGKLVLMHDRTVDRTTNGKGAVKDLDFATIRSLDAGSKFSAQYTGERVPTLEETLALCRNKIHIYLDHKEAPTPQVLAALKRYKMEKQVVVYNGTEDLLEWKRLAPHIPVMPSLPDEYRKPGGVAEYLKALPAEVLDGNLVEWTQELVAQAHAAGAKVYVDNLGPNDSPDGFRKAIAMGVDGIQTDHPDQLLTVLKEKTAAVKTNETRRGRAFMAFRDFTKFARAAGEQSGATVLTSPELDCDLPADEIVVSWNAQTPPGTGLKVEVKAFYEDHTTKWYTLGLWSKDGIGFPRESVKGQKDADGDVQTDTLVLERPAARLQLRITLHGTAEAQPTLSFLGVSLTDSRCQPEPREPNRAVWGQELVVPGRPQTGYPGASGWCSPTSVTMTLAFWAERLKRPELDLPVPEVAASIYDKVYEGTGNWPFNTAFAGSFPSLRAYVTRFADIRQLEDWIATGIPPIVSVSYDLLKGKETANDPGHLLVCVGFTKEGDLVLNDPAHHPEKGETARRVFPRANFERGWNRSRNTVYLIYPEAARLPQDPSGPWEQKQPPIRTKKRGL